MTLYELPRRFKYHELICKEVEAVTAQYGWSKAAMSQMRKLDSFKKETQQTQGLGATSMTRKALKDFTFSDGTHIPKEMIVSMAATARHMENDIYPDGTTFKGFRFSDMRGKGEETKNQISD